MDPFNVDWRFWLVVIGATIIKLVSSPFHSVWRAMFTAFSAIFSALVFTEPAVSYLGLDRDTYAYGVAAALALTGEGFMRMVISLFNKPDKLLEYLDRWIGFWTGRNGK